MFNEPVSLIWYCFPANSDSPKDEAFKVALRAACPKIEFFVGIPDFSSISFLPGQKIIAIEDQIADICESKDLFHVMTTLSRHSDISLIMTTQNLYQSGKYHCSLLRNCSYKVVFYDKADRRWISTLSRTMMPHHPRFLSDCMTWLQLNEPNVHERYLVLDQNPASKLDDSMQVKTRIFPQQAAAEDGGGGGAIEPIYFSPASK